MEQGGGEEEAEGERVIDEDVVGGEAVEVGEDMREEDADEDNNPQPVEFLKQFLDEDLLGLIIEETNK